MIYNIKNNRDIEPQVSSICECSTAFALPPLMPSLSISLLSSRDSNETLLYVDRSCSEYSLSAESSLSLASSPPTSTA